VFLHQLAPLFHSLDFLHVSVLFGLPLFPLLVSDLRHHFHVFFSLLLILVFLYFLVMLYFLLDQLLALFDETNFEPLFENLVGLLLLNLLLEPFFLFFSELLFPLQCFLHEFLFLPLVHATGALLIFLVLLGLLLHQLLI
jgi:hypothetical protein